MNVLGHPRAISRLQRLEASTVAILGRCPRLLHFAPLALGSEFSLALYRGMVLTSLPARASQDRASSTRLQRILFTNLSTPLISSGATGNAGSL